MSESAESADDRCTCFWTPPETWLSAASCGYGGGYEPGSQREWNPDCPEHPPCQCPTDTEIDAAVAANYRPAKPEGESA